MVMLHRARWRREQMFENRGSSDTSVTDDTDYRRNRKRPIKSKYVGSVSIARQFGFKTFQDNRAEENPSELYSFASKSSWSIGYLAHRIDFRRFSRVRFSILEHLHSSRVLLYRSPMSIPAMRSGAYLNRRILVHGKKIVETKKLD